MSDLLHIDRDALRRRSAAERRRAAWLAEEAKGNRQREWHANFLPAYGKSALAVYNALGPYLDERERAFNALADQHRYMADALDVFVNDLEHTDVDGGSELANVVGGNGFGPGHTGPSGPTGLGPSGPQSAGPGAPGPPGAQVSQPADPSGTTANEFAGAPAAGVAGPAVGTDGQTRISGPSPQGETTPAAGQQPPPGGSTAGAGPSGGGPGSGVAVPPVTPPGATPPVAGTPAGQELGAPVPVAPAAAHAGQQRAAERSHDVEPGINEDLLLARTLLAAILEAVEAGGARQSTVGLDWSVSVMRGPSGAYAFVTTSEGRWLPAGLFLPEQVAVPWLAETADDAPAGEEIADPAHVLVEFAGTWGARSGTQLTALVSSTGIDRGLRAQLDESVGVEANVGPAASDLDLALPGPGLLDRLTTLGGDIDHVPKEQVMARCVRLAADAHAQVVRTVGVGLELAVREVAVARGLREQIQAALQAGRDVPEQLWQDLWDADVAIAAALTERRSQVDRGGVVRQLLFERRCNELVLLLANGASHQTMRDVTYSYAHVLGHPQFDQAPVAAAEARGDRPVVAAPNGAVAPSVSPPVATPWATGVDGRVG